MEVALAKYQLNLPRKYKQSELVSTIKSRIISGDQLPLYTTDNEPYLSDYSLFITIKEVGSGELITGLGVIGLGNEDEWEIASILDGTNTF